jgi:transcriptional regulator with XRE-family HTH domain
MIDLQKLRTALASAKERGISANKIAERANIDPVSLANIKSGKSKNPKENNIRALEAALQLNKYDLESDNQRNLLDNNLLYLQLYSLTLTNLFKEEGYKVPASLDWLSKAERIENVFSLRVVGDIFLPKYSNDTELIVEPVINPTHKQQVIFKKNGQYQLRRSMVQGATIALWPINAQDSDIINLSIDDLKSHECELYRILRITKEPD